MSSCGAPSAYTDAGPPERIRPFGLRRATSSAPTWCGSSSENTPHSRTRRAISCEYWPAVVEHDDLVDRARGLDVATILVDELGRGRGGGDEALGAHASVAERLPASVSAASEPLPVVRRRGPLEPRAPMPTPWAGCSCLPSVCSAGATMSSARLNSAMSL